MMLNSIYLWYPMVTCASYPRTIHQDDDRGIADFTLVDFGVMFKFIEMEEAPSLGHLVMPIQ